MRPRSRCPFPRFPPQAALPCFPPIALALACLGIYGVISYIVSQRLREMGLRIALGARRLDIVCEVLGRAARLAIAGLAAG
jgi:putative ABC transport system permease protein